MATRSTPKKSEGKKPTTKRVSPNQATPEETVSNGPTAVAKAATAVGEALALDTAPPEEAAPCTRSHVPNARTRKALRDADAGKNLTSYADADDLFRKLGIKLGQD
jgi:hypothetical protein